MWLAPTAVWCRTWLTASPPWRRWGVVYSETACHHLRGGDFGGVLSLRACRRRPGRRNTRFRTAATAYRGGGNVRLRSSSPPSAEIALCGALVIVSAVGGDSVVWRSCHRLRRRRRGGRCAAPWDYLFYRANRANGANGHFDCKDSGW